MPRHFLPALILLLPLLAGCPPRLASVYTEEGLPPDVRWVDHEGRSYAVEHSYHLAEVRALCFDERISQVKVLARSGEELKGDALSVPLEGEPRLELFSKKGTRVLPIAEVKRVVFYEPFPEKVRKEDASIQVVIWPLITAIVQLGNDKDFNWTAVGVGTGVGLGMGSLFFFKKHQELEKVLFTYEFDTP